MNRSSASNTRLTFLFRQLISKKATPEEREELAVLMSDRANEKQVNKLMQTAWEQYDPGLVNYFSSGESEKLLQKIMSAKAFERNINSSPVRKPRWGGFIAAACTLLILSVATYLKIRTIEPEAIVESPTADIAPGTDKAVLTLSGGQQIALDDAPPGVLTETPYIKIIKSEEGVLVYDIAHPAPTGEADSPETFHKITTPRGGKYAVVLPDGSKVWLNAASSLRYPVRFSDAGRTVELTGEAYFEINAATSKNNRHDKISFKVLSGNQLVEVLGTHFNINSYLDEMAPKTTLIEGSLRVSQVGQKRQVLLHPGQQCFPESNGGFHLIENVDIDETIAWRDNQFSFKNSDIYSIMRQLERWYDIKVNYGDSIPPGHLTGYISRGVPLSRVLQMLEQTSDLKFRVENRTITVGNSDHRAGNEHTKP